MPKFRWFAPTLLVFVLRIAVLGLAPTPMLAEGPAISEASSETDASTNTAGDRLAVAPAATLPDSPVPQKVIQGDAKAKVIDKKFIAVMGALGGAESLRFTTHKLVLDREFAAGAPWVTRVPANQHLVSMYGGIYAAELLVTYELKKPHSWLHGDKVIRKLWWVYPAAMAPIHIMNGVRSIRTQAPAGCPPEECQGQ